MWKLIQHIVPLLALGMFAACGSGSEQEVYSQFVHFPGGEWCREEPCYFKPCVAGDKFGVKLSVMHGSEYEYADIVLTMDVVSGDTLALRKNVMLPLIDDNGNWTSDGFGSVYQYRVPVADGVRLDSTSVILLWQSMSCDTLRHISRVGIDITKIKTDDY